MNNHLSTIFISDLHLDENQPAIAEDFIRLLEKCDPASDTLYILGDLFEAWIGDDDLTPFNQHIIAAFRRATDKGLMIYIMHGNRDFLLGSSFFKATGCKPLNEVEKITVQNEPILLMHGDTLCTRDIHYLRARHWLRKAWLQQCFLMLPLRFRRLIANKARLKSQQHTQTAPYEIMDVTHAEVTKVMQENQVNTLIHGHTHRPSVHTFILNGKNAERIVLSAWHDGGSALIWRKEGKEFISKW